MTINNEPHTVRSFDAELRQLDEKIRMLAFLGREQLASAVKALVDSDVPAADSIVLKDGVVDRIENEVEAECIRMLALRQPYADDLRLVFSAIRAAAELERIGDYAKNIAKRVQSMAGSHLPPAAQSIVHLASLADDTLRMAADAFAGRDAGLAKRAWDGDRDLDEAYTAFFRETLTYMIENPAHITAGTHLLFIAKNIERIGDHATNLAELASYLAVGKIPEGERPKADSSPKISGV
ncbi:MAG: phosphate signaling complex protein PhoU [Alphaproteobacteria bacterium]|nr:phosphate signaling complex protein PhoU [Alphaproteobacteria bacterium]